MIPNHVFYNGLPAEQAWFLYWIAEREQVRKNKAAELPKPWSPDPIFQHWKFCNVMREDDRVSKWIHGNWCEPNGKSANLWFAMIVARLFNWPDTLEKIGFPSEDYLDHREVWRVRLKYERDTKKQKIFTGAYLVSTNGVKMDKIDYILDRVLTPIWEKGVSPSEWASSVGDGSLESYWKMLTQFDGLGSFMAGQVIADLKFFDPVLGQAEDWWTWAPLGPGSIRGINRFLNRPIDTSMSQKFGLSVLRQQQELIEDRLGLKLAVHNVQNCNCEYDKFMRIKNGEGRPRSTYPGVK